MSSNNPNLAKELESILDELEDTDLSELDQNEILEMRKKLNPYGRTIEGANQYMNFSITNIKHEYWKKFITSAMVGYLNRMNDEWKVPEGVPVTPVYDYLDDPSKTDTPAAVTEKAYRPTIDAYEQNREWMQKRIVVKEFLEEMFQFNPEEHVRSAYRPNRADTDRKIIDTAAGRRAINHLKSTDAGFRGKEELHASIAGVDTETKTPVKTKKVRRVIKGKDGKKMTIFENVKMVDVVDVASKVDGVDPTLPSTVREFLPPQDIFGRFKMYYQENYEPLRDFVRDAYCEKPDFELAINPYSVHNTPEEAEIFKKKHRGEVIAPIYTAHTGKWCFFDCFKKQRENINFYNDNTIILEEMMKQQESDERLGQDLMKKRVAKAKAKNKIVDGPDAESFKKWRDTNNTIKDLGAEHIGDVVNEDCPDDAVQVDVWRLAKGGTEMTKDHFYSAAEAPSFVTEAQDRAKVSSAMSTSTPAGVSSTGPSQ
jgi:hypothetical protein